MPETLDRVDEQLDLIGERGLGAVTLLVVPGRDWRDPDLARLRSWVAAGHTLAGHGWSHCAAHVRGARHRLHSALISRGCAEHLALGPQGIIELMQRCRAWFPDHGLAAPELYVPPAWAPGAVPRTRLAETGFGCIETLRGFYDIRRQSWRHAALAGFEARSAWQMPVLGASNACNRLLARRLPLRLALHPDDHRLALRRSLLRHLDRLGRTGRRAH